MSPYLIPSHPSLDWLTGVPAPEHEMLRWASRRISEVKGLGEKDANAAARERWDLKQRLHYKAKFPQAWKDWEWKGKYWNEDGTWRVPAATSN